MKYNDSIGKYMILFRTNFSAENLQLCVGIMQLTVRAQLCFKKNNAAAHTLVPNPS